VEFAVVAHRVTETNFALTRPGWRGARSRLLSPRDALLALGPGDVALNRLDVTQDVELCADRRALSDYVSRMEAQPWWHAGGVAQELVPPQASDLRVIVSVHEVVGAAVRIAAPREWRTNVALGGRSVATTRRSRLASSPWKRHALSASILPASIFCATTAAWSSSK
jgi:hypothetical protein